jgi:hypothetical protein
VIYSKDYNQRSIISSPGHDLGVTVQPFKHSMLKVNTTYLSFKK